jgi:hypothetical protein
MSKYPASQKPRGSKTNDAENEMQSSQCGRRYHIVERSCQHDVFNAPNFVLRSARALVVFPRNVRLRPIGRLFYIDRVCSWRQQCWPIIDSATARIAL